MVRILFFFLFVKIGICSIILETKLFDIVLLIDNCYDEYYHLFELLVISIFFFDIMDLEVRYCDFAWWAISLQDFFVTSLPS